jgi:hypothetical protein
MKPMVVFSARTMKTQSARFLKNGQVSAPVPATVKEPERTCSIVQLTGPHEGTVVHRFPEGFRLDDKFNKGPCAFCASPLVDKGSNSRNLAPLLKQETLRLEGSSNKTCHPQNPLAQLAQVD